MTGARWLSDDDASDIADNCIERFGRSFVPELNGPDRRVALVVLLDDTNSVVDITAIPPSSVGHYERAVGSRIGRRVHACDIHFGDHTGKSMVGEGWRARVTARIAAFFCGIVVPGELLPRLFPARALAYTAVLRGDAWRQ